MNELTKRVAVAAIGIPVAIGLFWLGGIWFFLAVVAISLGSLIEFINIAEKKEIHIDRKLLIGLSFIMQAIAYYLYSNSKLSLVFPVTGIFVMFSTLVLLTSKLFSAKSKSIESVFVGIGGMIYLPFMMLSLYFLREFNLFLLNAQSFDINLPMMNDFYGLLSSMQNHHWFWFVLLMFSGVWVCDSGAYFLGKAFGKHKLLERVSPKKTIEGAVGGFLCSALWFGGLSALLLPPNPNYRHNCHGLDHRYSRPDWRPCRIPTQARRSSEGQLEFVAGPRWTFGQIRLDYICCPVNLYLFGFTCIDLLIQELRCQRIY